MVAKHRDKKRIALEIAILGLLISSVGGAVTIAKRKRRRPNLERSDYDWD